MAIKRGGKTLSPSEQRAQVRAWTGWTDREYRTEYNRIRKQLVNYKDILRRAGADESQLPTKSAADLLAEEARAKSYARYYGTEYRPNDLLTAIRATSTTSKLGATRGFTRRDKSGVSGEQRVIESLNRQYEGIIRRSKYSERISSEVAIAMVEGYFSAAWYAVLLRNTADALDAERREARATASDREHPENARFFHS